MADGKRLAYVEKLGAESEHEYSFHARVWWVLSAAEAERFIKRFKLVVVPSLDGLSPQVGSHCIDVVDCGAKPNMLLEARLDFTAALAQAAGDPESAMGLTNWLEHCRGSDFHWYRVEADLGELRAGTLVCEPLLKRELSTALACEAWKGGKPRYTRRKASQTQREAWSSVPLQGQESLSGLVEPRLHPTCPSHRIGAMFAHYLEAEAAGRKPLVLRSEWDAAAKRAKRLGITTELHPRPASKLALAFDPARVPGWNEVAKGGCRLYPHQREAVEYALNHDLRCLIGDEMGLGKTASAVATAYAAGIKRVLVICPLNAMSVWEQEITSWSDPCQPTPTISSITATAEALVTPETSWVLISYETLAGREERIKVDNKEASNALSAFLTATFGHGPNRKTGIWKVADTQRSSTNSSDPRSTEWTFTIRTVSQAAEALRSRLSHEHGAWLDSKLRQRLERAAMRLCRPVISALQTWDAELVIIDEAHRVKDPNSRRTRTVRETSAGRRVLLLTGTPLRNHAAEGKALLEIVSPEYVWQRKGGKNQEVSVVVKDLLARCMIRRLKKDVLHELPPKLRQKILVPVAALDLDDYAATMNEAEDRFDRAWERTGSESKARKAARGLWTKAKRELGLAKLNTGVPLDYIRSVVEEKGYAIVFAHHLDVLSGLEEQLREVGISVERIDGRVRPAERKEIIRRFQAGEIQVFLGGLLAAGTAITLTKAETVIFVELDWVPADLMQAEDRGHRAGQAAAKYHIIHLVAQITRPPKPKKPPTPLHELLPGDCAHYRRTGIISPELETAEIQSFSDETTYRYEQERADRFKSVENIDEHIISALDAKVSHIAKTLNEKSNRVVAHHAEESGMDLLAKATKERVLRQREEKVSEGGA